MKVSHGFINLSLWPDRAESNTWSLFHHGGTENTKGL